MRFKPLILKTVLYKLVSEVFIRMFLDSNRLFRGIYTSEQTQTWEGTSMIKL
jgi:hypothetical protein